MERIVQNEDYNFLRNRMMRLEEAYKQSIDPKIRIAVRDKTLYDICERFPDFLDLHGEDFDKCQMSSLKETLDLYDSIMSLYAPEKLPPISSEKEVKGILKLKERALKNFIRSYNQAVSQQGLSYYSQRIDDKFVFLTVDDGKFVGAVTDVSRHQRGGESLCMVCQRFRRGDEILFLTNPVKSAKGEYAAVGQSICSDYENCNHALEDRKRLVKFLQYRQK